MKKNILKTMLLGILGCLFTSCFSDLDTMPLDDNELVSEKVYQTADGYTGVLAKCYSSLILTGQKGGDGGDGDLEGANEAILWICAPHVLPAGVANRQLYHAIIV